MKFVQVSIGRATSASPKRLSSFTKGANAVALSYSTSAGGNCDPACTAWEVCYAARTEKRPDRVQLLAKLQRHESADPATITLEALAELTSLVERGKRPQWFRFSTQGSVPNKPSRAFGRALRDLLAYCKAQGIPVHFPVETASKARTYRRVVQGLCVVRESCAFEHGRAARKRSAVSVMAGTRDESRLQRIDSARDLARSLTQAGQRAVVCPAVVASFRKWGQGAESKAKCGNCTACAKEGVNIVYPLH